jgi:hypothetical protein
MQLDVPLTVIVGVAALTLTVFTRTALKVAGLVQRRIRMRRLRRTSSATS